MRAALGHRLLSRGREGVCLLPEWICASMAETCRKNAWRPAFYAVTLPSRTGCPFGMAVPALLQHIESLAASSVPFMVVLAHPMGYLDPGVEVVVQRLRAEFGPRAQEMIFLDLSQAYGDREFFDALTACGSMYWSHNGNKLICCGGAVESMAVVRAGAGCEAYRREIETNRAAARKEVGSATEVLRAASSFLGSDRQEPLLSGQGVTRSSRHRTVIWLPDAGRSQRVRIHLRQQGLGQSVLERPQGANHHPSEAFQIWRATTFLLFPCRRAPC